MFLNKYFYSHAREVHPSSEPPQIVLFNPRSQVRIIILNCIYLYFFKADFSWLLCHSFSYESKTQFLPVTFVFYLSPFKCGNIANNNPSSLQQSYGLKILFFLMQQGIKYGYYYLNYQKHLVHVKIHIWGFSNIF